MKTQLLYLDDSYLKTMDATVLEVKDEGNGIYRLLLDKTVFYPMGGGQPTDQGVVREGEWNAQVYQVMMKDGEVWHYVKTVNAPTVNSHLQGEINWERRYKNMRVHSAGHVVDFAMYVLGYSPKQLVPLKGDHGKKPYIVYQGQVTEDIKNKVEEKANELVAKSLKFTTEFQPLEKLETEAIYLQPGLPNNKPLRTLRLESIGAVADGGTQVATTQEVGSIKIDSIERQESTTIVRYSII